MTPTFYHNAGQQAENALANRAAGIPPRFSSDGTAVLYHGNVMRSIGILCLFIAAGLLYLLILILGSILRNGPPPGIMLIGIIPLFLLFLVFVIAFYQYFIETFLAGVTIDDEKMVVNSPLPWYPKTMYWQTITKAYYSPILSAIVLVDSDGNKARISTMYYGIGYLAKRIINKLDEQAYAKTKSYIETLANHYWE